MNTIAIRQAEAAERIRLTWAAGQAESAKAACTRAASLLTSASRHQGLGGEDMAASAMESVRAAHRALAEIIGEFES